MMTFKPTNYATFGTTLRGCARRGLRTLGPLVLTMTAALCGSAAQARIVGDDRNAPPENVGSDVGTGGGGVACVLASISRPGSIGNAGRRGGVRALAPVVCPVANPIRALLPLPPVPGIGTQPLLVDLSAGQAPTMTTCLLSTVRSQFGADAVYLGESANGVAKFSVGGRTISFYPLQASTDASLGTSIPASTSNVLTVGTSCGRFTTAPALGNLSDFGAYLNSQGLVANIDSQGLITVTMGASVLVFRPDYIVNGGGTPGTPQLVKGSDGLYRFTDSAGNVQILYPAFVDTAGLGTMVQTILSLLGSIVVQLDGTALFTTITGQQFVLTPDVSLTAAPAANAAMLSWQDAPNHYFFRSSVLTMAQGFSVRQQ